MFTDRFEIQKKDYSYSAQVNFAECREKVKIDPNATVCVDFMKEEQEKKAVKAAESPHTVAQSTQQDSAKPTLSPREASEIALEDADIGPWDTLERRNRKKSSTLSTPMGGTRDCPSWTEIPPKLLHGG